MGLGFRGDLGFRESKKCPKGLPRRSPPAARTGLLHVLHKMPPGELAWVVLKLGTLRSMCLILVYLGPKVLKVM